jgi:hypothetical protein
VKEEIFKYNGLTYTYWPVRKNERCVEVALGEDFINSSGGLDLEVGNVMRMHQRSRDHFVVDLYEEHPDWSNYENQDVLKWSPDRHLNKVLSISTLEHCNDLQTAVQRVLSWAEKVLITIPLGYRPGGGPRQHSTEVALMQYGTDVEVDFMARWHAGPYNWLQISRDDVEKADSKALRWGGYYYQTATAIAIIRKGWP